MIGLLEFNLLESARKDKMICEWAKKWSSLNEACLPYLLLGATPHKLLAPNDSVLAEIPLSLLLKLLSIVYFAAEARDNAVSSSMCVRFNSTPR